MPNGDNYTESEHFIPRMYFNGFSEIRKSKEKKTFICEYDLKSMNQIPVPVNVKSICAEDNLYELRGKDGSFITQNVIEKTFGKIEEKTSNVIKSIIEKSQKEECLNCANILSDDDKSYLIIFMTALKFRTPDIINDGIKFLKKTNSTISDREARNFTLLNLLPLGADIEWDENTIIRTAIERYSGMAFQIGVASDDLIITSDRPIIEWPQFENELYNRPGGVAFPLTSRLVLYMCPFELCRPFQRNCFFKLNDEQIRDIQTNVAIFAKRWIFSRNPLTEEQLTIVKKARS